MEIREMTMNDIETRSLEIAEELEKGGDVETLEAEVRELEERKAEILKETEERKKMLEEVERTSLETVKITEKENEMEIRNSKQYIDAFANYIKTGKDAECRALLTENVSGGTVPVPEFVYDIIKTAWEREDVMSRVRKTAMDGNLKVGFEINGSDAVVHVEGSGAIDPEILTHGIVTLVPQSIKKLVQISDEAYDLRGEAFLRYIYDEVAYKIAKKEADVLVAAIMNLQETATATSPAASKLVANPALGTIAQAIALLSDEASNPVVIMNKATWGAFKAAQYSANFAADPFEGLAVLFNNTLPAYEAGTQEVYAIVGDLEQGALANYPKGDDIQFKFDELTKKDEDIIEILGRRFVGLGVVANNAFVLIKSSQTGSK